MLLFQHAGTLGAQENDRTKASSHFVVGGVSQTITAWLAGDTKMEPDELVEQLSSMIDTLADTKLSKN
jgi:hypothetical protein